VKPDPFVLEHLSLTAADHKTVNNFSIRTHFKHLTATFLEAFEPYWQFDVTQPRLCREFDQRGFLKGVDKHNKFVRQFMRGKVDKSRVLYERFVKTRVFLKFLEGKR
jgi:hypothetical protein